MPVLQGRKLGLPLWKFDHATLLAGGRRGKRSAKLGKNKERNGDKSLVEN
jgi:hypothetical protein